MGKSCKFVPDLALMSFILFFGTYSMTLTLKKFKFSRYFPTKVRKTPGFTLLSSKREGKWELSVSLLDAKSSRKRNLCF